MKTVLFPMWMLSLNVNHRGMVYGSLLICIIHLAGISIGYLDTLGSYENGVRAWRAKPYGTIPLPASSPPPPSHLHDRKQEAGQKNHNNNNSHHHVPFIIAINLTTHRKVVASSSPHRPILFRSQHSATSLNAQYQKHQHTSTTLN